MRVVTWNMGLNGGRSGLHDQAWRYLLDLGPDLAFVQESRPPAWVEDEGQLVHEPITKWGSAIFSPRLSLAPRTFPDDSRLTALRYYLAAATVSLDDGSETFVVSVHARPAHPSQEVLGHLNVAEIARAGASQANFNDLIFHELSGLVGSRFIAAGDWNTARTQGSEAASRFGAEFFARAADSGWYDCSWNKLQGEIRTWFREGDVLIQDDYVFCDPSLGALVRDVSAPDEAPVQHGFSDHAPLIVDFDVSTTAAKEPAIRT